MKIISLYKVVQIEFSNSLIHNLKCELVRQCDTANRSVAKEDTWSWHFAFTFSNGWCYSSDSPDGGATNKGQHFYLNTSRSLNTCKRLNTFPLISHIFTPVFKMKVTHVTQRTLHCVKLKEINLYTAVLFIANYRIVTNYQLIGAK